MIIFSDVRQHRFLDDFQSYRGKVGTHKQKGLIQYHLTWNFEVWLSLNYEPRKAICWKRHTYEKWKGIYYSYSKYLWAKTLYLMIVYLTWSSSTKLEGETETHFCKLVLFFTKVKQRECQPRERNYTMSWNILSPWNWDPHQTVDHVLQLTALLTACEEHAYNTFWERKVESVGMVTINFLVVFMEKHKHSLPLPQIMQLSFLDLK